MSFYKNHNQIFMKHHVCFYKLSFTKWEQNHRVSDTCINNDYINILKMKSKHRTGRKYRNCKKIKRLDFQKSR